ncbi:hypothetical protein Q3G72_030865 [Acer saccharum]|nr:hypothetical protein Q3G72_030865 [Acer saccharum]
MLSSSSSQGDKEFQAEDSLTWIVGYLKPEGSNYTDVDTGIDYISDAAFIETTGDNTLSTSIELCLDQIPFRTLGNNFLSESSEVEACDISGLIQRQLSNDDNDFLCSIPTEEEVKRAVFSIPKDSSPGPDGFGSEFYMSCWDIVKDDVMDAAVDFFQEVRPSMLMLLVVAFSVLRELVVVLLDSLADHIGSLIPGIEKALNVSKNSFKLKMKYNFV